MQPPLPGELQLDHDAFRDGYIAGWRSVRDEDPVLVSPCPAFIGAVMYLVGFRAASELPGSRDCACGARLARKQRYRASRRRTDARLSEGDGPPVGWIDPPPCCRGVGRKLGRSVSSWPNEECVAGWRTGSADRQRHAGCGSASFTWHYPQSAFRDFRNDEYFWWQIAE
jgi:hypothetical protein